MLAREIFYNYSVGVDVTKDGSAFLKGWFGSSTSTSTGTATATTDGSPYVSTTAADPSQSSYRIPVLSRFNGTPGQSNSQSVLNAGLTITTPRRG